MAEPKQGARRGLTVIAVLLLLVAVFFGGLRIGRGGHGSGGAAGGAGDAGDGGTPPARAPDVEGTARSVSFQGDVAEIASLRLLGGASVDVRGEVKDGAGAAQGEGLVTVNGADVTIAGPPFLVAVRTELRVAAGGARILGDRTPAEALRIRRASIVTLTAADIQFTPTRGSGQRPLPGPVSVTVDDDEDFTVRGSDLTWADAPAAMRLTAEVTARTTLSWAGDGAIRAKGGEHRAEFLGLKARELNVGLERDTTGVRLRGDAEFVQVYKDGLPQLPAQARVRIKSRPAPVARGSRGVFTWAPENDGDTDMTILRVRPENPDAAWVSLGLERLPEMCGGESCPGKGGETQGLRSGSPINAVILPKTGDERDITFAVPSDAPLGSHTIVLVVEGNFEPIRVEVPFEVIEPSPTTTRATR